MGSTIMARRGGSHANRRKTLLKKVGELIGVRPVVFQLRVQNEPFDIVVQVIYEVTTKIQDVIEEGPRLLTEKAAKHSMIFQPDQVVFRNATSFQAEGIFDAFPPGQTLRQHELLILRFELQSESSQNFSVIELQNRMDALQSIAQVDQKNKDLLLIGEIAYVIDRLCDTVVVGWDIAQKRHVTYNQSIEKIGTLQPQQDQELRRIRSTLSNGGVDVNQALTILRKNRLPAAHPQPAVLRKFDTTAMINIISLRFSDQEASRVIPLLENLSKLTSPGTPLIT